MHRKGYCQKINSYLRDFGLQYDCDSKEVSDSFFDVLTSKCDKKQTRQDIAIKRAERIMARCDPSNPAAAESSTQVYQLVQELEKFK